MALLDLTAATFKSTVQGSGVTVIDWWAPWCGPCRAFAPIFARVAAKHPDVTFAKINTEQESELAQAFSIQSIPTLMVIREGVLLFTQAGMLPEAILERLVADAQKVDMEQVRSSATAGAAAAGAA